MELDRSLLTDFAKAVNQKKETSISDKYVKGTVKTIDGKKYVQLDGSTVYTPISETVDVQDNDRVLVSIENHSATILGNFTFPPSARKELEAIEKADDAQSSADNASEKADLASQLAQSANSNAQSAMQDATAASNIANEAKQDAADAIEAANSANENLEEVRVQAAQAVTDATQAKKDAADSLAAVANANVEIENINTEITNVKSEIDDAIEEVNSQAAEISIIKESYATKVETDNAIAEVTTDISAQIGQIQTNISENYYAKTDIVEMTGDLQTQITQNAQNISMHAGKLETLESDTEEAQKQVDIALQNAANAQTNATNAKTAADAAQAAANQAKTDAETAQTKAESAATAAAAAQAKAESADAAVQTAQGQLNEAKQNLVNVTNRVDATEEDIVAAQAAVEAAQTQVNQALEDAAEANYAATQAQNVASQAQTDAATAQTVATNAQNKADSAQTAADNAQTAANKAQADVAALTKRVTTAETNITQNSEAIELNAEKVEEIGDKLENNYYSKTETDAKIKIESDRISQTVTKVETVEKNSVVSSVEQFYLSTSPTSLAGGSWSTNQPTWDQGRYIWRRTLVTKGDGTTSYSPSANGVCITGNTGATGATGQGISSITTEFYLSTSKTTQTGGSWVTTHPTWETGKYVWTRSKIVYKNPASTVYTTPVCDTGWEAANEIELGGRNLLLNSNTPNRKYNPANYPCARYELAEKVVTGEQYTISINVTLTNTTSTSCWALYFGGGTYGTAFVNVNGDGTKTLSATFTATENMAIATFVNIYIRGASGTASIGSTTCVVSWAKLEKGNKATDWTPAPEDFESDISSVYEEITKTQASIETTADGVVMEALESYAKKDELNSLQTDINSKLELLPNQMELNFNSKIQNVVSTNDDLQAQINEINKNFTFNTSGLTIGQIDSPNKLNLDNSQIALLVNGATVQKFNAQGEGFIPSLYITTLLNLFGYAITEDAAGHVSCVWVGKKTS